MGDCEKNVSLCSIEGLIFFDVNLSLCLNILKALKQPRCFSACSHIKPGGTKKTKCLSMAYKLPRKLIYQPYLCFLFLNFYGLSGCKCAPLNCISLSLEK